VRDATATARRGRPNKVNRDQIVDAAHSLGLDGLTMQAVAAKLEVSPGALYRHVGGLDDVARSVTDRMRRDLEREARSDEGWRDWLRDLAVVIREQLGGSASALLGSTDRRPMRMDIGEPGLRLLIEAGLPPVDAAHALWLVVRAAATVGSADKPSFRRFLDPTRELVAATDPGDYSALERVSAELADGEPHDSFPFEIEVLLDGIAAQIEQRHERSTRPSRAREATD
jgi:AcrR family transcriptional regulator